MPDTAITPEELNLAAQFLEVDSKRLEADAERPLCPEVEKLALTIARDTLRKVAAWLRTPQPNVNPVPDPSAPAIDPGERLTSVLAGKGDPAAPDPEPFGRDARFDDSQFDLPSGRGADIGERT